ncbi:alpha/beta fold hydrolase [Chitinivorax sp. B]|uniref:alpha/beta hydrolase n=1 Tax=Chitinivorax sp. B TaxID=2502235 RepID=UPI0010F50C6B|nr:alpha/beta fold hydrolase [Chitinivorax sp. B]
MIKQQQIEWIDGPVGKLETIVIPPPSDVLGIAVLIHPNPTQGGTNTNKVVQMMAKVIARRGYMAYLPNCRGVGQSIGEYDWGNGETDDVVAVIDYAKAQQGDLPLVLGGFSFGTHVASQARQRVEAEKLILAGPACKRFPVPEVPKDTLVIHGEEDEVIPLADVLDWARPQALPVVVVPGCSHFFHGKLTQLADVIDRMW